MKKQISLIIIGFIGLIWITYLSFDLLRVNTQPNYLSYFNKTDSRVVVIHDWRDINPNNDNIVLPPTNEAIVNSLASKASSTSFYVSTSRPIIVIERNDPWNKQSVRALFRGGIYPFQSRGNSSFSFGKFNGRYANNKLILHSCEIKPGKIELEVDRKATFSVVKFLAEGIEVCDVFKKLNSTYFYRKTKAGQTNCKKHDDKKLFASVIPDKFTEYSFFDKYYLSLIDPVYKKSLFRKWTQNGIVIIRNDNKSLAIFDFGESQNPIQNLNEFLDKKELNEDFATYQNVPFSSLLNRNLNTELFVAESDGYCLVSHDKSYLDEILTEIKMGHSLSQNEEMMGKIFANLPKKVAARIVDSSQSKTLSVIGSNFCETSFINAELPLNKETKKDRDYFSMNPGERVVDFAAFNERGNLIALTESNKIIGYINGIKKWERKLAGDVKLSGDISKRKYVSVCNQKECLLFDRYGKIHFRFSSSSFVSPQAYSIKNKDELLAAISPNKFAILNNQGAAIKEFSCSGEIKEMSIQENKKHEQRALVLTNTMLYAVDLAKRKTILKLTVDSIYHLTNFDSGIYAVSYSGGKINTIDSKGKKTNFSIGNYQNKYAFIESNQEIKILLNKPKSIALFDAVGKRKWNKHLILTEITEIKTHVCSNGKALIVILDNIENELYLLDSEGNSLDQTSKHGEKKVEISEFGSRGFSITTFLGDYLIQYNLTGK